MQQVALVLFLIGAAYCGPQYGTVYIPSNRYYGGSTYQGQGRADYGRAYHGGVYPVTTQETATVYPSPVYPGTTYQAGSKSQIPILRFENNNNGDGSYNFAYETGNGIAAQEQGLQKSVGEGVGTAASGSYSYTGPDGHQYSITYTADENGFRPVGAHIPTPPPIPEAILRALKFNAAEEAKGTGYKGDTEYYRPQHQQQYYSTPQPAYKY